jgi:protein TonB
VPPGLGVPEAAGAERGRGPVRDFSLERPRVEPPVLPPIATEPLLEPTGEITPAAAVSEEFIRQAADAAPPPPELAVHGDELVGPDLLRETRREPRYPEAARRLRIEASVLLQVLVREDGTVGEVSVLRCTRPKIGFEEAALEAVREWRFRPASLRGRPVPATVTVKVDFVP